MEVRLGQDKDKDKDNKVMTTKQAITIVVKHKTQSTEYFN
uniref:Uncharacterized protein n=1 Tax=Rhizophora mucronata TaxID=61149 RepID=A0A2P2JIM9_RHIMU